MSDTLAWIAAISGAAGAAVSVIGGVVSVVFWFRAKGEREEAANQADIATKAQVGASDALQQIAEVQAIQAERHQARAAAEERDPWSVESNVSGGSDMILRNNTDTPKFAVQLTITVNGKPWKGSPHDVGYVGPRRTVEFKNPNVWAKRKAVVTWQQLQDESDERLTQAFDL